jgi:Na+-translocating ferredoxin:NAD+ oxidoreductase RnfE subunit
MKLISGDGMLLFILPPGAFLALGYLIVLANMIKDKSS